MSGQEMLREIERRDYYRGQRIKSAELSRLYWTVLVPVLVTVFCLFSIYGHFRELLQAF